MAFHIIYANLKTKPKTIIVFVSLVNKHNDKLKENSLSDIPIIFCCKLQLFLPKQSFG